MRLTEDQWLTLFLSPYALRVLHHMRVDSLKERFGLGIVGTFLSELSEAKLTIVIHSMNAFAEDIDEDGALSDFLRGYKILDE